MRRECETKGPVFGEVRGIEEVLCRPTGLRVLLIRGPSPFGLR